MTIRNRCNFFNSINFSIPKDYSMGEIHDILKRHWGYESFRPLQEDIIRSVMSGRDTLGLMPTGGGKSITFQVPAIAMPGTAIVVTPLISLMKDQTDNLKRRRVKAVYYHSGMSAREVRLTREKLMNGGAKLLYVSPERLRNVRFLQELRFLEVSMIVVDEAHCISQWGYDFRPSYLEIAKLRKMFPHAPVLALTATATPIVEQDIVANLGMKGEARFRMSFSRSNLNYIVRGAETKIYEVFHILSRTQGSAIVYVRSRRRTREISDFLESGGISATFYHAGLDFDIKEERQNRWQRGAVRVMVATNAFGMGIDKPDVRVVIHYDMPPSLEEYYQEAGRAGRDGKISYAVLLTSKRDAATLRRRVTENFPPRDDIKLLYDKVCDYLHVAPEEGYERLYEFDPDRFCEIFGYQRRMCLASLHLLGQAGYMEYIEEAERRSRVMILVQREELYNLGAVSAGADATLRGILRLYPGLFSDYIYIDERKIAAEAGLDERGVYEALLELRRKKTLSYVPRSRTPYIYFPTSREERRYLMIGKRIYEERKDALSRRTEAMIDYAYKDKECREKRMLAYFGETTADDCGRCDVCRKRRAPGKSKDEDALLRIADYLKSRQEGADVRIMERDLRIPAARLSAMLSHLCGDGFAEFRENLYFWRGEGSESGG